MFVKQMGNQNERKNNSVYSEHLEVSVPGFIVYTRGVLSTPGGIVYTRGYCLHQGVLSNDKNTVSQVATDIDV